VREIKVLGSKTNLNVEYPENENALRKTFFEDLDNKLGVKGIAGTESSQSSSKSEIQNVSDPIMDIKTAQKLLNQKGYNVGTPDGKIGPKTAQAIKKFQTDNSLSATGTLTSETILKLQAN